MSIWDVRVTTRASDVASCRFLVNVDSRDPGRCGSTVQPTPEECLRYQVRYAGGDTLLINGPIGKAYDCSGEPSTSEPTVAEPPAPSPPPVPTPTRSPEPAPTRVPTPGPAPARGRPSVRITGDREAAKGCVYLGDVPAEITCSDPSTGCVDEAIRLGGNLVVVGAGRAQVFSCQPKP